MLTVLGLGQIRREEGEAVGGVFWPPLGDCGWVGFAVSGCAYQDREIDPYVRYPWMCSDGLRARVGMGVVLDLYGQSQPRMLHRAHGPAGGWMRYSMEHVTRNSLPIFKLHLYLTFIQNTPLLTRMNVVVKAWKASFLI